MLHASLDSIEASGFVRMVVGVCCRIAWRMLWVKTDGMSDYGMLVVHLVCLLARRSRPYASVLKVGRIMVKEYGHALSCWGIT